MLAYDYPLISLFLLICWWFFIFAIFFGVIWAFVDNFRRRDHSGWAKAGWAFLILILPLFGMLIYLDRASRRRRDRNGRVASVREAAADPEVDDGPLTHPHASLGYRAEQTGLLLATGAGPLTFQRTLMPRSTSDQALITGLSFAANHALASLLQESLQSAALLLTGAAGRDAVDERRWSRATLAVDAAAIAAGLGVQRALAPRDNERLPRAGARAGGFVLAATGARRPAHRRLARGARSIGRSERRASQFVVVPAAAGLAVGGELFRRWRAACRRAATGAEGELSVAKSLAMSLAVIGVTTAIVRR